MKLDDDTRNTLEGLEHVEDAPLTATHGRSASLLQYLMAAGYVENSGPGRMRISDVGRRALADHRGH
ncbi:putative transcriptional regulator [Streptomyces phage Samy]|uniref:hypothetical protein n=1 Tax=Streptomyces ambofaciens TaxID=1889 RepID=UPI00069F42EF|nr:hypothetical protein [Streptomyces ambofaciens]WNA15420.1 putative transcriptional regulator [Streptomyces phage Samy]